MRHKQPGARRPEISPEMLVRLAGRPPQEWAPLLFAVSEIAVAAETLSAADAEECVADLAARLLGPNQIEQTRERLQSGDVDWLQAHAGRCAENTRKRVRRRAEREVDRVEADSHGDAAGSPARRRDDPAEITVHNEAIRALYRVVSSLPPNQRVAFRGRYERGQTVEEIAAETGRAANAVHQILYRARERVRTAMERAGVDTTDLLWIWSD